MGASKLPEAGKDGRAARDLADMSDKDVRREKLRMMKNILIISFSFLCVFTAFQGLQRIQSSLHVVGGMGVINSAILYGGLILSCILVPRPLISLIGHKWTIPASFMGYILWMAANGYATWYTMVPASILVGLCAAPLWTAQCSYFTLIAKRYAEISGESEQAVLTRFFGIFFFFFQITGITGSVIISTILKPMPSENTSDIFNLTHVDRAYCGINDCPWDSQNMTTLATPSSSVVWTMLGVYMALAVVAVLLVVLLVDQVPKYLIQKDTDSTAGHLAIATLHQLRHKEQLLLIPLTLYSGFEQAFYGAEFTKSFVACPLGIWTVGLVTIPFGVVNALVSFTSGRLAAHTGRLPIFTAGLLVDLAIQLTLRFWSPVASEDYALFILSSLWGLTDGIWQTQINALYGNLFSSESEAAFANYRLWESTGFISAFAYSNFLCTSTKLDILTGVLVVGIMGYYITELLTRRGRDDAPSRTENGKANDEIVTKM